jgi:hypothetical protein
MRLVTLTIKAHKLLGTETHPEIVESVAELETMYIHMTNERDALRASLNDVQSQLKQLGVTT